MDFHKIKSKEVSRKRVSRGRGRGPSKFIPLDNALLKLRPGESIVVAKPDGFKKDIKEWRNRLSQRIISVVRQKRIEKEGVEHRYELKVDYQVCFIEGDDSAVVIDCITNKYTEEEWQRDQDAAKKRSKSRKANAAAGKKKAKVVEEDEPEEDEDEVEEEEDEVEEEDDDSEDDDDFDDEDDDDFDD